MSESIVITSAVRTPIGSFMGALSNVPAPKLGATAIRKALEMSQLPPDKVDECIMGNVLTAGIGQAPARQAAIYSGLPQSVECMTINKVCGSGLKAVMLGSDSIRMGNSSIVVAGGQENMSMVPHYLEKSRMGFRMGPIQMTDGMVKDGLWDPYNDLHMGSCTELCVKEYGLTREAQDQFAIESYKKAQNALAQGLFKNETVSVEVTHGKETMMVTQDEEPGKAKFDKMPGLKPSFEKTGTITAANASKINDGAAALVLMTESKAKQLGIKPLAKILGHASFAQDPKWFSTSPIGAIKKALSRTGLQIQDIDLFEINEAFAAVTMAAIQALKIDAAKVNVNGGAVALGHPIGASGARVLATLIHTLHQRKSKLGLATLCIGGGEASALIVERVN